MRLLMGSVLALLLCSVVAPGAAVQDGPPAPVPIVAPAGGPSAPVVLYVKDNAPAAPRLEDLPLKESVSRHGITWTFEKPARCGQFVSGDWYVIGPATVVTIEPKPVYDDAKDVRNGSMLNPPPQLHQSAFDSRIGGKNWFRRRLKRADFPLSSRYNAVWSKNGKHKYEEWLKEWVPPLAE